MSNNYLYNNAPLSYNHGHLETTKPFVRDTRTFSEVQNQANNKAH